MRSFFPFPAASGLMMTAAHTCHSASFDFPTHVSIGVMNIPIHTGPGHCSLKHWARPNGGGVGCRQQTQIRQERTYLDIRGERGLKTHRYQSNRLSTRFLGPQFLAFRNHYSPYG
ncbi:hypothetical protein B0H13DRAFT_1962191 [Mycena leptocephala]|nr:hypothetical protein B0H13DRAFT_1962191 [Mycena leptocephala]